MSWLRLPFAGLFVAAILAGSSLPGAAAAEACPNETLRSENHSLALPDCRAYELVTPAFKSGGYPFTVQSWLSGSGFVWSTLGAPGNPGDNAGAAGSAYTAARAASGWSATPIDPPASQFRFEGLINQPLLDISADLGSALYGGIPASAKPVDYRFYLRRPDGSFAEVGPAVSPATVAAWTPTNGDNPTGLPFTAGGASQDLSHVVFLEFTGGGTPTNWLWPGDTTVQNQSLYEYIGTGHTGTGADVPALVGVDNAGNLISQCGTYLGGENSVFLNSTSRSNAISADGGTIFFTAFGPAGYGNCGATATAPPAFELFARIDNTLPSAHTVSISEPTSTDCSACDTSTPAAANFQGASSDGSKAFFLTSQPLLGGDSTQNLYSYDFNAPAGQKVTRISAGDPAGANVEGVARVSADASHVYFVASGVLSTAPNNQGQTAQEGNNNLYVYEPDPAHPGQSKIAFIAALPSADSSDWSGGGSGPVETTPDGRFLLFQSAGNLTPDASGAASQLYRYDSQTGDLVRVSIGENGFNSNGNVDYNDAFFPTGGAGLADPRPTGIGISDDGAFVFFESFAGLTPQAVDDPTFAHANVYEYHSGHVYLISDGQDRHEAFGSSATSLIGATPTGSDVFFSTADPLVPGDTDTQLDFYDARINGGFPAPAAPASCQGDTCQAPPAAAPSAQSPGSSSFTGAGNRKPRRHHRRKHHKRHRHRKHRAHRAAKHNGGGSK